MTDRDKSGLTHIGADGAARMVDISAKADTARTAIAEGRIAMAPDTLAAIREGNAPKGDVLGTARIAAIQAAKRTADTIPLCHATPLSAVNIEFDWEPAAIRAVATIRTTGKTGAEMEALHAVSVALLTIYDMAKALDKGMAIGEVRLLAKSGGASGDWRRT